MPDRRTFTPLLLIAGAMTALMGGYHFFLPLEFGWSADLAHDPMLQWALLSINSFFSFLLLMGGLVTIVIGVRPRPWGPIGVGFLAGMTSFWFFNACYQLLFPMPLPHRLSSLAWVLAGFAILAALFYAISLSRPRQSTQPSR